MEETQIEDLFLRTQFIECRGKCIETLKAYMGLLDAKTTKIEIEAYRKDDVEQKFKTAVILIQCIYESEVTVSEKDLLFVERFLKQNGPLPFDLVITWVQFKIHLGHLEYVKELVAGFLESFNARIKKGGLSTPELCDQYSSLAQVYIVQTLPRLGEAENAQKFLARLNNSQLLSRDRQQLLLYDLDQEIANSRRADQSFSNEDVASEASSDKGELVTPVVSQKDENVALVLTKGQVIYAAAGAVSCLVLISQRKRLAATLTGFTKFFGNAVFSGT